MYSKLKKRFKKHDGILTWKPSSVYMDPAISLWSVLFKVFAPQFIAMTLYVISFFMSDPRPRTSRIRLRYRREIRRLKNPRPQTSSPTEAHITATSY